MIDELREDRATLSQILAQRRAVTTVTMSAGQRLLWGIYLTILDDALKILNSLLDHMASVPPQEAPGLQSGHDHTTGTHEADQS